MWLIPESTLTCGKGRKFLKSKNMKKKIFLIIKNDSERVRRKNFQTIDNVPLYQYFINSKTEFDIYIDTDSREVFEFYEGKDGITCYARKQEHIDMELSGNVSPAPLMIKRFLEEYVKESEDVITSHVTSPFIKSSTINNACALMDKYDSVSSVEEIKEFAVLGGAINTPINFSYEKVVKTQSLEPIYILNGAFFIIRKKVFLGNGYKRISSNHHYFPVKNEEALDIDLPYHLKLAKILAKEIK